MLVRHARACRWVALGASIAASVVTAAVAVHVIGSASSVDGTLFRHAASETVLGFGDTVVGVVSHDVESHRCTPSRSTVGLASPTPSPGPAWPPSAPHSMRWSAALEVVFVADGVIAFLCGWEVMTLATAALVATEHESRASRRAAYLFLVMSHVGTGCLLAGFLILGSAAGSLSFRSSCPAMLCRDQCALGCSRCSSSGLA